jgi:hypothetical protein
MGLELHEAKSEVENLKRTMRNRKGQTGKQEVLSDKTAEELFLHYKQHGAVPNYDKQDTSRAKASILWWDGMMTDAEKASHAAPLSCCTPLINRYSV